VSPKIVLPVHVCSPHDRVTIQTCGTCYARKQDKYAHLAERNERLREALSDLADYAFIVADGAGTGGTLRDIARSARAALKEDV